MELLSTLRRNVDLSPTFVAACTSADEAGVVDVAMTTLAVEQDSFGVILRLTDEETFHLCVDDDGRRRLAAAYARRIQNDSGRLLLVVT